MTGSPGLVPLLRVLSTVGGLSVVLIGLVIRQKLRFEKEQRWRAKYRKALREVLVQVLVQPQYPNPLPAPPSALRDAEVRHFLREVAAYVAPQTLRMLQPRLVEWGIPAYCKRRLRYSRLRRERLQVLALALLLEAPALPPKRWLVRQLRRWSQDPNTQVTALALQLLLRQAPDQWRVVVSTLLENTQPWNPTDLRQLILSLPKEAQERLWGQLRQASSEQQLRVLEVFLDQDPGKSQSLLREPQTGPEALSRILRRITSPYQKPEVLALLGHPQDFVRLQAVKALGRIGSEEDLPRLHPLLQDPSFWVRKRSAESLWQLTRRQPELWTDLLRVAPAQNHDLLHQAEVG